MPLLLPAPARGGKEEGMERSFSESPRRKRGEGRGAGTAAAAGEAASPAPGPVTPGWELPEPPWAGGEGEKRVYKKGNTSFFFFPR